MKKKILKNMEWGILICSVLLLAIGMVALFSATQNSDYDEFIKQGIWALVSIPVVIILTLIDYELIAKISPVLYGIFLILLVAVFFTEPINGATSWFDLGNLSFQPAELAKVFVIIFIAYIMNLLCKNGRTELNKFWKLGLVVLSALVPIMLIAKQPDYGTAIAFFVSLCFMLFASGIKAKYIIVALLLVVMILPILYFFVLPEHAKTRLEIFLDPEQDPRGAGYNIIQSKLAIGAGELLGMGLFKGNQTQLGFLYPKTTDFIFAVIGEELGFLISSAIIVLYVIMITKAIYVAKTAKDDLGSYIAMGIAGMLFFHMAENIGMTIGLLPITGIPLPFVSYGGSSLLTNFIAIALLLNISRKETKSNFCGVNMLLHSLKIGNVELENNVLLAPMAGITDKAFRKIIQNHGAGLTCTEMCSSKALFFDDKKTEKLMDTAGEKRPIAIQIFGSDPEIMGKISKRVATKCDIIDINMGCPAPKVVKNGDGSRLLQKPDLVEEITSQVVKNAEIPVTVKIRSGWDNKNIVAEEIAKRIEQAGASAITVHGRTREQYYGGKVDLDIIRRVRQTVKIPVIGNGDIVSAEAAKQMIEETGVRGIMIGRGALGNPWIFDEIISFFKNEKSFVKPSKGEKLKTMLQHLEYAIKENGEKVAVLEMRKHFSWYIKNMPEAAKIREKINRIESSVELKQAIIEYFNEI